MDIERKRPGRPKGGKSKSLENGLTTISIKKARLDGTHSPPAPSALRFLLRVACQPRHLRALAFFLQGRRQERLPPTARQEPDQARQLVPLYRRRHHQHQHQQHQQQKRQSRSLPRLLLSSNQQQQQHTPRSRLRSRRFDHSGRRPSRRRASPTSPPPSPRSPRWPSPCRRSPPPTTRCQCRCPNSPCRHSTPHSPLPPPPPPLRRHHPAPVPAHSFGRLRWQLQPPLVRFFPTCLRRGYR